MKSIHERIEFVTPPYRSQSVQLLQFATMLQLETPAGSSELADFANAADYEQTARLGQH